MVFVTYSGPVAGVKEESSPSQGVHTRVTQSANGKMERLKNISRNRGGKAVL